jgi:hypothetical protein
MCGCLSLILSRSLLVLSSPQPPPPGAPPLPRSAHQAVLTKYPTNIRRRILRHLYNEPLQGCWLFEGVK